MKSGSFVRSLGVGILLATAAPLQLLSFNAYANTGRMPSRMPKGGDRQSWYKSAIL